MKNELINSRDSFRWYWSPRS